MSSYTDFLSLLKKDPVADAADTFNIKTMLNDNWDKLDSFAASVPRIVTGTYIGTGTYATPGQTPTEEQINKIILPAGFNPAFLFVCNANAPILSRGGAFYASCAMNRAMVEGSPQEMNVWYLTLSWAPGEIQWYLSSCGVITPTAGMQMNIQSATYAYLAIGGTNYEDS